MGGFEGRVARRVHDESKDYVRDVPVQVPQLQPRVAHQPAAFYFNSKNFEEIETLLDQPVHANPEPTQPGHLVRQ